MPSIEMPLCEVCGVNKSITVCCVPGLPYSAAYCERCYNLHAEPYWCLLFSGVTALEDDLSCRGNTRNAYGDDFFLAVFNTCEILGKTTLEFERDVIRSERRLRWRSWWAFNFFWPLQSFITRERENLTLIFGKD